MKALIFHLVNGVRSRIPLCCNLFFSYNVFTKKAGWGAAVVHEERTGKEFDVMGEYEEGESHYVQCNRCYAKNRVKEIRSNGVILKSLIPNLRD